MSVRRISVRKRSTDIQNKRWSIPVNENNEQEEQISSQSPYLTSLINKLGIPKVKALVKNIYLSFFVLNFDYLENEHV